MNPTILSIDLDWFNGCDKPSDKLTDILQHVPRNVPSILTIEHHQFLPHLKRWVKRKKIDTPFDIVNIDEHHDYYVNGYPYSPDGYATNCGVWGFRIPTNWYRRYIWVRNEYRGGTSDDWEFACRWMKKRNITPKVSTTRDPSKFMDNIVAVVACISPDYIDKAMLKENGEQLINQLANHLKVRRKPWNPGTDLNMPEEWSMIKR